MSKTPHILSGAQWTNLEITWLNPDNNSVLIQVFENSKTKPFAINEIFIPSTLFEVKSFGYVSLSGSASVWKIESENEDGQYLVSFASIQN